MSMAAPSLESSVKVTGDIEIDTSQLADMSNIIAANSERFKELYQQIYSFRDAVNEVLINAVNNSIAAFAEMFGRIAAGKATFADLSNALLSTLGDAAIQVGKIAIGTGLAMEGIKKALNFGNPWVAIAAGVALIALGTAVKSSLKSVASGAAGGAAPMQAPDYQYDTRRVTGLQPQTMRIEVVGEFVQRGSDLVAVINRENKRKTNVT